MKLDSGTIIQLSLVCNLTFYLLIRLSFGPERSRCVRLWLDGLLLTAGAAFAFMIRFLGWMDLSVLSGNTMLALGTSMFYASLCAFMDRTWRRDVFWIPVSAIVLSSVVFLHEPLWRVPLLNLLYAIQNTILAITALTVRRRCRLVTSAVFAGGFGLFVLACLIRMVIAFSASWKILDFFASNTPQALTMTMILISLVVTSFCFVLMHLEQAEAEARNQAVMDHLTRIPNRRSYDFIMAKELSRLGREHARLSLLIADIDFFKKVNDRYGHEAGDCVLASFAAKLVLLVREHDYVFRYGGEEFCVILRHADKQTALSIAERVRSVVEVNPVTCCQDTISYTVSIGAASCLGPGPISREELFRQADAALLYAKRTGRNRVTHHDDLPPA